MATREAIKTTQELSGTKLEAVLAELCARLGTITITKAVKLPYLVDVAAKHVLGRRITDATFEAWEYGVVTREAWELAKADGGTWFRIGEHFYSEGGRTVALAQGAEPPELEPDELAVVGYVVDTFGHLNAGDLGDLTKSLNPDLAAEEWGSNRKPSTGEDAFARLSPTWLDLWRRLPDLELDDTSLWGDPIQDAEAFARETMSG
jgi:uncharacterized phage-associated protein